MKINAKVFVIVALATILVILSGIAIISGIPKETQQSFFQSSDVSIEDIKESAQESTAESTTENDSNVDEVVQESTGEYADFEYDYNEDLESYLSFNNGDDKVNIEGYGTPLGKNNSYVQAIEQVKEAGVPVVGTASETQKYWYQMAQKRNYMWALETDFSNGFGVLPSLKYDIWVKNTAGSIGLLNAPNDTEVLITEYDSSEYSLITLRNKALQELSLEYYTMMIDPGTIPYNTSYTLGVGLDDLDIFYEPEGMRDITLADNNNQIYVDDKFSTKYSEGYYIEAYNYTIGQYVGYYVADRNGRLMFVKAKSEYNKTLRDIVAASIDVCTTVY